MCLTQLGLSVFWLSNINNFFHDNAAVGGHLGIWSFTHSASRSYQYLAIPVDPVSGKREWRNNKASGCNTGFIMDLSVKDDLPTAQNPRPQFSVAESSFDQFSMNDDPDSETDERPNLLTNEQTNWAHLFLTGWKIHHTTSLNWVRNIEMTMDNWQYADNQRSMTLKVKYPIRENSTEYPMRRKP